MQIANALSRLSPEENIPIPDLNEQIHHVCPQFSCEYLQKIQARTAKDPELTALEEVGPLQQKNYLHSYDPIGPIAENCLLKTA